MCFVVSPITTSHSEQAMSHNLTWGKGPIPSSTRSIVPGSGLGFGRDWGDDVWEHEKCDFSFDVMGTYRFRATAASPFEHGADNPEV